MNKKRLKDLLEKFWFIVWKDDSIKGWLISLIFLFVVIKLIFFPLLSLATGTHLPLVIVESCSMYHQGDPFSDFEKWWDRHDMKYFKLKISESDWRIFHLKNGFNKGDILFVTGVNPEDLKLGDIIIFNANYRNPVIHRIISIKEQNGKYFFSTIGDNNNGQLQFEKNISETQIVGKARMILLPYVGWGKLIFFEKMRYPEERGFCNEN